MPINKNAYRRFAVIDAALTNKMRPYPNMEDLRAACMEKLDLDSVAIDTIQKDIKEMKKPPPDGFNAPIYYNRFHRGYEYTDPNFSIHKTGLNSDDLIALEEITDLLQIIGGSRLSNNFSHAVEKVKSTYKEALSDASKEVISRQAIQTELAPKIRGFEYFDTFYKAIKDRFPVSFIHYSYTKREFKSIILHPVFLKEFDKFWYVVGFSETHQGLRTFGLDRIYDPLILIRSFMNPPAGESENYLDDVYGVYPIKGKKKQEVSFYAEALITNYIEARPIHNSQKIKKYAHGDASISLDVIPSYELVMLLRSYGSQIGWIEPEWLSDMVYEIQDEEE